MARSKSKVTDEVTTKITREDGTVVDTAVKGPDPAVWGTDADRNQTKEKKK